MVPNYGPYAAPYDPFIFAAEGQYHGDGAVTGRALEIHLDDYEPTDLGSASLTLMGTVNDGSDLASGSVYRASSGLPWGLLISDTWIHPRERTDILNAYLNSSITPPKALTMIGSPLVSALTVSYLQWNNQEDL